jgi:hypothetical protein
MVRGPHRGPAVRRVDRKGQAATHPGFGGEQDNLTDRNDAQIVFGSPAQNVANFVGKTKILAIHHALIPSTFDRFLQYIRYLDVNGERRELCAPIDRDLDLLRVHDVPADHRKDLLAESCEQLDLTS